MNYILSVVLLSSFKQGRVRSSERGKASYHADLICVYPCVYTGECVPDACIYMSVCLVVPAQTQGWVTSGRGVTGRQRHRVNKAQRVPQPLLARGQRPLLHDFYVLFPEHISLLVYLQNI